MESLYTKYRPKTFEEVVGQEHVVETLKRAVLEGKVSHAYLFCGPRGTGKTTMARILAKALMCQRGAGHLPDGTCEECQLIAAGEHPDVLELDAASRTGVDNVREEIISRVNYAPVRGSYKVYIIDEVHMLTIPSFNALLKIMEEPPEHLLFILATTELHKVPATILSRCQRFAFRRISPEDIAARLQYVSYQENIDLDDEAARVLARLADGGMRDALSLLDQCASATVGELSAQRVYDCLGIAGERTCGQMMGYVADHNTKAALELFNRLYADGKEVGALLDELICLCRDLMVLKTAPNSGISMLSGVASDEQSKDLARRFSSGELIYMIGVLQQTVAGFTRSASRRMDAEMCLMNLCEPSLRLDAQSLNARLGRVEEQLRAGVVVRSEMLEPARMQEPEEELPPPPGDESAPPEQPQIPQGDDGPVGFWTDLATRLQKELKPPSKGFFVLSEQAPVHGRLCGNDVIVECANAFTMEMVNVPEVVQMIAAKAGAILGRPVGVKVVDITAKPDRSPQMEQLLSFGKQHKDIVTIKTN